MDEKKPVQTERERALNQLRYLQFMLTSPLYKFGLSRKAVHRLKLLNVHTLGDLIRHRGEMGKQDRLVVDVETDAEAGKLLANICVDLMRKILTESGQSNPA